jgi:hypothetical protein
MALKSPNNKLRFDAFERSVSFADVRRELPKANQELWTRVAWTAVVALFMVYIAVQLLSGIPGFEGVVGVLTVVVVVAFIIGLFLPLIIQRDLFDILRVKRFAEENGLTFLYGEKDVLRTGMIFNRGSERELRAGFASTAENGQMFEIANYTYVVGSGKNRSEQRWGFIRIVLSRQLPRMVIDGKRNNFIGTNLPEIFDSSQRLQLEGNFNDYFDVYVPAGYENDALYVLTPDIMALLLDEAAGYDIEITGNQLFIYAHGGFELRNQANIEKLVTLTHRFQGEFEMQTDYYADERIGDRQANIVAEPGRTLKTGINWVGVSLLAIFLYLMYGGDLPLPQYAKQLLIFVMFGFILIVLIREIRRQKKLQK